MIQSIFKSGLSEARAFQINRAAHMGMCFGVRDAIALAHDEAGEGPLTVLGELVHNEDVLADLRRHGVQLENRIEDVATPTVMITAHGTSEKVMRSVRGRGHRVIEATCPLVHVAHRAVRSLVREGCHLVIIGRRDHVEVRGLTGDLTEYDVILEDADVLRLAQRPRFGVAAQTTQPIERVRHLVELMRRQFPRSEIRFHDTVCQPTKQRQTAAVELALQCDLVIVVGGANSNNTRELAATCRRYCGLVYQVTDAEGVQPEWFEEAKIVGLTAGTSTPDQIIDTVEIRLREISERRRDAALTFQ